MMVSRDTADAGSHEFDWPVAYEAELLLRTHVEAFLARNSVARVLASRMLAETGTDFYEWVDHFSAGGEYVAELLRLGFAEDDVIAAAGTKVFHHPRAMMPRVLVTQAGTVDGAPASLTIQPESVVDFAARNNVQAEVRGTFGARLRQIDVASENGACFRAVERLAERGFQIEPTLAVPASSLQLVQELWRMRRRDFDDDAAAWRTHSIFRPRHSPWSARRWRATFSSRRNAHFGSCAMAPHGSKNTARICWDWVGETTTITRSAVHAPGSRT
jgi:hypothetical protein